MNDYAIQVFALGAILSAIVMLGFCDRIVTPDEISRAEKLCENANSELAWFETNFFEIEVTCKNSAKFFIGVDGNITFETTVDADQQISEVNQK